MYIKKHIPNIITLGNLFSGLMAILLISNEKYVWAVFFVFLGALFDFFDGMFARMLGVSGELGKQMDSLADMISFGVVPGLAMYTMLKISYADTPNVILYHNENMGILLNSEIIYSLPGFLITLFSAIRLAKFNIDTRQTSSFIGLPTPAATLFILSLFLIYALGLNEMAEKIVSTTWALYFITIVISYLLVAELPLFSLKFKTWNWHENKIKWVFISMVIILLLILKIVAIPLIIIIYIVLSLINNKMPDISKK